RWRHVGTRAGMARLSHAGSVRNSAQGIDRHPPRQRSALLLRVIGCHREKDRRAAERIDDREECGEDEQHAFDDLTQVGGHGLVASGDILEPARQDGNALTKWRGKAAGSNPGPIAAASSPKFATSPGT